MPICDKGLCLQHRLKSKAVYFSVCSRRRAPKSLFGNNLAFSKENQDIKKT
ncbi:MAG: hypothetical protein UW01_C0005G0016 [Candidatus Nomurabacteria bacterium GW2011_GWA2_43_66]|nr:MAG: hypothetical protein UV13_C0004G0016 [Parcubacteria group bacterium GW2011_GWC1_42_21]KKT00470.1 MAG: hypothetical protein UV77_C0003G0016 [Candidatus Nomurabacteria bacterium GW2011_GWA1_43_17]KKT18021.1 MAG: hypothetical protein UW01_C0005G0016 [Candidatus Nomurabacteria bacterium GW2011_GWA2_43_66]